MAGSLMAALCLAGPYGPALAADTRIGADTTWSGQKTLDGKVVVTRGTLSIEPGTRITFQKGSEITVRSGATLTARGTDARPVEFVGGAKAGLLRIDGGTLVLERCRLSHLAGEWSNRPTFLWANCGPGGVTLRKCLLTDCGGAWVTADNGPFAMTGCDLRRRDGLYAGDGGLLMLGGKNKVTLADNTLRGMTPYSAGGDGETVLRGNVFVRCGPVGFASGKVLVEGNYVRQPLLNGSFGMLNLKGTIRNNVVRGGTWTTCGLGGTIRGNVFETLSPADIQKSAAAGFKDTCTHENLAGVRPGSVVTRNIIVNPSYGAVMGAADNTCADCVLRNNTFDLRGGTAPVWLNHLVKGRPRNLVLRNNLFLRTGRMYDEKGIPNCIAYTDYNLWAGTHTTAPSAGAEFTSKRFVRISLTGKKEGDDGFGAHDVFAPAFGDRAFDPKAIVADPDFVLPFSDEDMLARKHTVRECLDLYRKAYTPRAGSPALNAGSPADRNDPEVKDGKCDIGAVEK